MSQMTRTLGWRTRSHVRYASMLAAPANACVRGRGASKTPGFTSHVRVDAPACRSPVQYGTKLNVAFAIGFSNRRAKKTELRTVPISWLHAPPPSAGNGFGWST
jgi:hypothetical protein